MVVESKSCSMQKQNMKNLLKFFQFSLFNFVLNFHCSILFLKFYPWPHFLPVWCSLFLEKLKLYTHVWITQKQLWRCIKLLLFFVLCHRIIFLMGASQIFIFSVSIYIIWLNGVFLKKCKRFCWVGWKKYLTLTLYKMQNKFKVLFIFLN